MKNRKYITGFGDKRKTGRTRKIKEFSDKKIEKELIKCINSEFNYCVHYICLGVKRTIEKSIKRSLVVILWRVHIWTCTFDESLIMINERTKNNV